MASSCGRAPRDATEAAAARPPFALGDWLLRPLSLPWTTYVYYQGLTNRPFFLGPHPTHTITYRRPVDGSAPLGDGLDSGDDQGSAEEDVRHRMDIYLPRAAHCPDSGAGCASVLFFHGGSFEWGDRRHVLPLMADYLTQRGIALASADYTLRQSPTGPASPPPPPGWRNGSTGEAPPAVYLVRARLPAVFCTRARAQRHSCARGRERI